MSSTATIITVLASAAFALIVIAVVVRVAPKTQKGERRGGGAALHEPGC